MRFPERFSDYSLVDVGAGQKLEKWGSHLVKRPEPQAIWPQSATAPWDRAEPVWDRRDTAGRWPVRYGNLTFLVGPTGGKQLGLFPEQATNWDFITESIRASGRQASMLNLFAYTGGATIAAASAGARVCHVDASRAFVAWAKQNLGASGLAESEVRFIVDDALKFVRREIKRGSLYDAIVLDPPSFGRGPGGEPFSIRQTLPALLEDCSKVLSARPLFVLLNVHTTGLMAPDVKEYLLTAFGRRMGGRVTVDSIGLKSHSGRTLGCGITGRWVSGT